MGTVAGSCFTVARTLHMRALMQCRVLTPDLSAPLTLWTLLLTSLTAQPRTCMHVSCTSATATTLSWESRPTSSCEIWPAVLWASWWPFLMVRSVLPQHHRLGSRSSCRVRFGAALSLLKACVVAVHPVETTCRGAGAVCCRDWLVHAHHHHVHNLIAR